MFQPSLSWTSCQTRHNVIREFTPFLNFFFHFVCIGFFWPFLPWNHKSIFSWLGKKSSTCFNGHFVCNIAKMFVRVINIMDCWKNLFFSDSNPSWKKALKKRIIWRVLIKQNYRLEVVCLEGNEVKDWSYSSLRGKVLKFHLQNVLVQWKKT